MELNTSVVRSVHELAAPILEGIIPGKESLSTHILCFSSINTLVRKIANNKDNANGVLMCVL